MRILVIGAEVSGPNLTHFTNKSNDAQKSLEKRYKQFEAWENAKEARV